LRLSLDKRAALRSASEIAWDVAGHFLDADQTSAVVFLFDEALALTNPSKKDQELREWDY
jgi:hypothetical protein